MPYSFIIYDDYLTVHNMADVKAAPFSTSPFFYIPLDHGGLTILVCVVNDVLNRDGGMHWLSKHTSRSNPALYNIQGKEDAQDVVSVHSLVSVGWDTYTCFISQRSTIRFKVGHDYGLPRSRKGKSTAHHLKWSPITVCFLWVTHSVQGTDVKTQTYWQY